MRIRDDFYRKPVGSIENRAGSSGPADLSVIIVHVINEFISAASRRISLTVSVGWK
jgi:hypothetical protein